MIVLPSYGPNNDYHVAVYIHDRRTWLSCRADCGNHSVVAFSNLYPGAACFGREIVN